MSSARWGSLFASPPPALLQSLPNSLVCDREPVCHFAGDVLFQMAEVHRQIQVQLEEMVSIGVATKVRTHSQILERACPNTPLRPYELAHV